MESYNSQKSQSIETHPSLFPSCAAFNHTECKTRYFNGADWQVCSCTCHRYDVSSEAFLVAIIISELQHWYRVALDCDAPILQSAYMAKVDCCRSLLKVYLNSKGR